jgi:hypothetical protein
MANNQQLAILKKGVRAWNEWRAINRHVSIDLREATLPNIDLSSADVFTHLQLHIADLTHAR